MHTHAFDNVEVKHGTSQSINARTQQVIWSSELQFNKLYWSERRQAWNTWIMTFSVKILRMSAFFRSESFTKGLRNCKEDWPSFTMKADDCFYELVYHACIHIHAKFFYCMHSCRRGDSLVCPLCVHASYTRTHVGTNTSNASESVGQVKGIRVISKTQIRHTCICT